MLQSSRAPEQHNKETLMGPSPEGFSCANDAIPEATWTILQTWLDSGWLLQEKEEHDDCSTPIPWEIGAQNRQVAQFGFRYDYDKDIVDVTTETVPTPPRLKELLNVHESFTQCIINRYEPDILIPWHKDDLEFGPTISVFTFGEARPLLMRRADNHDITFVANPGHCSHYTLSGSARYEWEHMVPTGSGFRVSFTFRTHKDG
jgi:alkylated DNA repair dioxygenase AlkB